MPFWEEIARFNTEARVALRARGLLGQSEVVREAVRPLTWTQERKGHWAQYERGDQLLFVRDTRYFRRGTSTEVVAVLPDGLRVARPNGRFAKITRRQCSAFDVGRRESLPLSVGDRLLIRGAEDSQGFANGDFKTVEKIDSATNEVWLNDGKLLPISFRAWTHGHAMTSYRAQGSTAEESLVVLGEVAERALTARQFYVGNTRYRGHHHIYVSHRAAILERLAQSDPGRETATEFLLRRGISRAQEIAMRPLQRLGQRIQNLVWHAIQGQRQRQEETMRQNIHH